MKKQSTGILPTCKEVHRLASEGMDRELSLVERIRMRLHMRICVACARFERQMALLRGAMRSFPADATDGGDKRAEK
ncbi:MAG: hypothetical protein ACI83P_000989 [Janthinobacterium sp.]|jgi:hypothetical protein